MKVLTTEEMKKAEQFTMKSCKITVTDLMEKAGEALTKDFLERVNPERDSNILVIAGKGNNGGDALVMLRLLRDKGYKPHVLVFGDVSSSSDSYLKQFDLAGTVELITSLDELNQHQDAIFQSDYIIDGLFGTGLNQPVSDYRKDLIGYMNASDTFVYSIDIPSGLNPNNGLVMKEAVIADMTGILGTYKLGNILNDAMDFQGDINLLEIGLKDEHIIHRDCLDMEDYQLDIPVRPHTGNKYTYGYSIFIGGRPSMMGSIQMAAMAGLKAGLGISKVISNLEGNSFTQFYPELIIQHNTGADLIDSFKKLKSVVYGPGIDDSENNKLLLDYLLNSNIPVIIDASGLEHIEIKRYKNPNIILTPHMGELSKLLGVKVETIQKDPLRFIKRLTSKGFNVLLKGSTNILATKERTIFMQVTNTGLATAGSGDVLSGILAANIDTDDLIGSVADAVYIHAESANYATEEFGVVCLTASDLVNNIYKVLRG